jgi:hypothetical protein
MLTYKINRVRSCREGSCADRARPGVRRMISHLW